MNGIELIAAERARQISDDGWTAGHDDRHIGRELALAARTYLSRAIDPNENPAYWPWDATWWKPSTDPVRNLVKAGALIAAEIDRLQRASAPAAGDGVAARSAGTSDAAAGEAERS